MTETMMDFQVLVEKTPDADIMRDMKSFAASRLIEMEVGELAGAAHGEKNPLRRGQGSTVSTHTVTESRILFTC